MRRTERFEPLDRHGEVRPALARNERVDLVHDERLDAGEELARRRREHQVERFGRRDEHVAGRAAYAGALFRGGVPRADVDTGNDERRVHARRLLRDAGQRPGQIPVDVDGERLVGRDVHDARTRCMRPRARRRRMAQEAVDRHEKGREGLAGPGRSEQQHRFAPGNGRPSERLRSRGLAQGLAKPGGHRRKEKVLGRRGSCVACLLR